MNRYAGMRGVQGRVFQQVEVMVAVLPAGQDDWLMSSLLAHLGGDITDGEPDPIAVGAIGV